MKKRNFMKAAAGLSATAIAASFVGKAQAGAMGPVLAVVSHPVKDFAAWRVVYDSVEAIRQKAGVTDAEVFQDPKDPNMVVIIHRFPTVEAAQAFLGDPALKEAMMKGGVTAPPTAMIAVSA